MTLGEALRGYRFYVMWISISIVAGCYSGAFINMPAILMDAGMSAQTAASIMGVLGIGIFAAGHHRPLAGPVLAGFRGVSVAVPARHDLPDPAGR